ncbi:MAG: pantetheine-phosphate adenylyltransferase [Lachnospira sp.]|nr:pantetheine-phosphate adenylyltransferase [Lachnospira sp.]
MKRAIYPGSFDPVTVGHLDIISRSAQIFDEVIVGVLNNNQKAPLFCAKERVALIEEVTKELKNVRAEAFSGLLVDFARKEKATTIIRGLRAVTDFEYELQMSQTNRQICPEVDTLFLTASVEYSYVSSSTVKEIAYYGGDISAFVPDFVAKEVKKRFSS